jgi:tetratricopeptide (TPR) repeat protein
VLALGFVIIASLLSGQGEGRHIEAYRSYQKAERSQVSAEREEHFNKSLMLYKHLEDDYQTSHGNGKLQYNIANTYFQLGQYPSAVLYYQKALKLDPWNDQAWANLQVALKKLQISNADARPWWQSIFSPSLGIPETQRLQMFFALALAAILFAAFYIWKEIEKFKSYAWIASSLAFAVLVSLVLTHFSEPAEAIVLRPSDVYRDAGKQYAKVQSNPLPEGVKLQIIELTDEGRWAKVRTPEGVQGFVPIDRIGII